MYMNEFVAFAPSLRKDKKYQLTIMTPELKPKTFHFGSKNSSTYVDHGDRIKRANYIKRHQVNEDWTQINPASLSRYILWETPDLKTNLTNYMKKFNIRV